MAVKPFQVSTEYDRQAADARKRRRMADLLAQQVVEPTQYGPGPTPAAAPLVQGLQAFIAARAGKKAEQAAESAKETGQREARQFLKAFTDEDKVIDQPMSDTPTAMPKVTAPQFEDGRITAPAQVEAMEMPQMAAPQVQLSRFGNLTREQRLALALEGALTSENPAIQRIAQMQYQTLQPQQSRLQVGAIDPAKFTPQSLAAAMQSGDVSQLQPRDEGKSPTVAGGMMWSAEKGQFVPIPGYAEQQGQIAASKRPDVVVTGGRERERLVSVIGSDGKPKFVRESEAEGMMPFTARTAADLAADETREQTKRNSAFETGQSLQFLADLIKHPGRKAATGASYALGKIPGTEARGFVAKLDTFKSQMFLPAVKALQGLGALSNAEGMKLTDAIGALNVEMEEKELESEMRRIGNYLFDKAQVAGLDVALPAEFGKRAATSPPPGFELE